MSTSRAKRQFAGAAADPAQRQITSFFSKNPADDIGSSGSPRILTRQPLLGPALPSSVQADLLTVGMRVRKSVPEGYKTSNSSSAYQYKPWAETMAGGKAAAAALIVPAAVAATKSARSGVTRELLPFCGINKIGGFATQPEFQYDEDEDEDIDVDVPSLDDVPEFTISQESAESIDFEFSRKRPFDDEEFQQQGVAREVGPLGANARLIAIPRTRVKGMDADLSFSQEDMVLDNEVDDGDFPEARFLVFGEGR